MQKMRYFTLAAILHPTLALAQVGAIRPPDVQPFEQQPVTYAPNGELPRIGNGVDADGGPPAVAQLPAIDNSAAVRSSWTLNNGASFIPCTPSKTDPCEMKYRFTADPSHTNHDDPIRFWGQPGKTHCHQYFGNNNINAQSTWKSIRTRQASTSAGGNVWATGYWEPCIYATIDGKTYIVTPNLFTGYYSEPSSYWGQFPALYRGLRFVGGVNPDDPDDKGVKAEIAAANAMPGNAGRYEYQGNGFQGYACIPRTGGNAYTTAAGAGVNNTHSRSFVTAAGGDPWLGSCKPGDILYPEFNGPTCIDMKNLWSPTGMGHVRQAIRDTRQPFNVSSTCPQAWGKMPGLQGKSRYTVGPNIAGKPAYMSWSLSSTPMASMAAGRTLLPGEDFHFDWINGIDSVVQKSVQDFCLGMNGNQPNTCDAATISATQHLIGGYGNENSPDGSRSPQVRYRDFTGTEPGYLTLERTKYTGSATAQHHGM